MANRMFRVTSIRGCEDCGLRVGDVSELVREGQYDTLYLKALPHWVRNNVKDTHCVNKAQVEEAQVEEVLNDGIQTIRDAVTKAVATATPAQVIAAASALGLKVEQQTTYRIVT